MAGEWIKVSTNLPEKPEVFQIARAIGKNVDHTVGLLFRFWCWADLNTVDGYVDGIEADDVDAIVRQEGFCRAMEIAGWVECNKICGGLTIKNFSRHNGESAKKRLLKNERQARWRAKSVDESASTVASTKASTREEKRREDKTTKASAFALPDWVPEESWKGWLEVRARNKAPNTERALKLALADLTNLRGQGHDPAAVLDTATARGWRGLFAPPKDAPKQQDQFAGVL